MVLMDEYLSFDVGGTTIKTAIINDNFELSEHEVFPTNHNQNNYILNKIIEIIIKKSKKHSFKGIGVSTGGIVDPQSGTILYAGPTIPNYKGTPLKTEIEKRTHIKANIVNDVNAALLGEYINGNARGYQSVYCIALGTGIGGAFMEHEHLYYGAFNQANSIGYMMYDPQTKTNFEQRASTLTLERLLRDKFGISPKQAFIEGSKDPQGPIQKTIDHWINDLGSVIANIILLLDPELILIGGAVSQQEDRLIRPLKNATLCYLPPDFMKTTINFATLHNNAALYGALFPFINREMES